MPNPANRCPRFYPPRERLLGLDEIMAACQELEHNGLVENKHRIFVHPTPLCERLISLMTGRMAPTVKVAPLPALPK